MCHYWYYGVTSPSLLILICISHILHPSSQSTAPPDSSPSTWHSFTSPLHHLHCAPQHRPLPCLHDWSHRSSAPQGGLVRRLAGSKRSAWDCIYSFPSRKVKTNKSVLRTSRRVLLLFADPEGTTSSRIIQEVAANSTSK